MLHNRTVCWAHRITLKVGDFLEVELLGSPIVLCQRKLAINAWISRSTSASFDRKT